MPQFTFSVVNDVGRLIEARLHAPQSVEDIDAFREAMRAAFVTTKGRALVCADWRGANLLAPPVADALTNLLRRGNAHVERAAVLLPHGTPLFSLQVERVLREAANPTRPPRRAFASASALVPWLAETATEAERRRIASFLGDAQLFPDGGRRSSAP